MTKKKNEKIKPRTKQSGVFLNVYAGFIFLFLPFFYLSNVIDYTLMPRLLALSLFLLFFGVFFLRQDNLNDYESSVFRNPLVLLLGLFVLVTLFSMFFSVNVKEGFFDLAKFLMFSFLVIIGAFVFKQDERWRVVLAKCATVSAMVAGIIGFVQYFLFVHSSPFEFLPDGRPIIYKVDGVMSHKNLFSLSLFMLMPWIGYGIYTFRKGWRLLAIFALTCLLILVILLKTRAVWSGLLVSSALVFLLVFLFFRNQYFSKQMKLGVYIVAFILLSSVFLIVYKGINNSENQYIRQFVSMVDMKSGLNINRLKSWSLTVDMIRDNYSTGVGAGNWQINAPRYYPGRFSDNEELNWIRPHNDFLWVFAEKGISGILIFISIFAIALYFLLIVFKRGTGEDKFLSLLLIWGIFGYMVASLFDFPYERPWHLAALSIFLSASIVMYHRVNPAKPLLIHRTFVLVSFLAIMVPVIVFSFSAVRQEALVKMSLEEAKTGNWTSVLTHATQAESSFKNLDPWANPVKSYIGKAQEELGDLPAALAAYEEAYRLCPTKLKVITNLARIYEKTGNYNKAETMLDEGLKIIPNHTNLLKQKCDIYYAMGNYQKAIETYKLVPGWQQDSLILRNMEILKTMLKQKK